MDAWMRCRDGLMGGWMDGWMGGWMGGWMEGRMYGCIVWKRGCGAGMDG